MSVYLSKDGLIGVEGAKQYVEYSWVAASANTWHQLDNVDVFGGRDTQSAFDVTIYWTELNNTAPWGVFNGRFVCDYAAQNGRTYYPIWSTANNGSAGYANTLTSLRFTKPDAWNQYGRFVADFSSALTLNATMRLTRIHSGIAYAQAIYY